MMITVPVVNAFIDGHTGGNPAGVVLDSTYTHEQKLQIAAAVGLSETAFVSPSTMADFKLDFYTPNRQIAHCGHATIATFSYLSQLDRITNPHTSKETIDGRREIVIDGEMAYMEQSAPSYIPVSREDQLKVARSLGLDADSRSNPEPLVVNTGNSFLIQQVRSKEALAAIQPDLDLIAEVSETYDLIGFYPFCRETEQPGRDASTRMFGPRYSITEEAATGMAAGPLACYLFDKIGLKKDTLLIEQGYQMSPPSPSVITVQLKRTDDDISGLMAGGKAVVSGYREIEI